MLETVVTYFLENFPWIAALCVTGYLSWKAAVYYTKVEDARKKVDSLPCDRRKEELDNHLGKVAGLEDNISSLTETVDDISKWLMKFDSEMINSLAKKHSPSKLTFSGEQLLEASGGKKVITDNLDYYISEIKEMNPNNPYDVEKSAMKAILGSIKSDIFVPIKNYLYYSPDKISFHNEQESKDEVVKLSIYSIIGVMTIFLRDEYLKRYPLAESILL